MKVVRVTLKQTPTIWFDRPLAEGDSFAALVGMVRVNGYFMTDTVYIQHDQIAHMIVVEFGDAEKPLDFTKARMQ